MKGKYGKRLGRKIAVFEDLRRIDGLRIGVDTGIDRIGYDPLGERLAVWGIHRRQLPPRG